MEDASDNIINYKKLVKEQTGISVKEQMKKKKEKEEKMGDAQNANPSDKMLETNGGGGHMAAVIRRIEALYQGGVQAGDDSDSSEGSSSEEESEEEEESDGEEEEYGEKGEGEEDGSEDDDDDDDDDDSSGSEMEDDHPTRTPGGTMVPPSSKEKKAKKDKGEVGIDDENANKSAPGSDEKQTQNDQEKKKKTKKKDKSNKRRRRGDVDWYDVDDDWIDDEELDEYFDRDGRKTKHSGFFVNKGEIQNVNADGTTPVKGEAELTYKQKEQLRLEAEARGKQSRGLFTIWTEPQITALKQAVEEFGNAWTHISNVALVNEKYAPLIGKSKEQMGRKWVAIREEMIAEGIELPTQISRHKDQPFRAWKVEDENDPELVEIVKALVKNAQIFSGKIADESGLHQHTSKADKAEKVNSKLEEFCIKARKELFHPLLHKGMVVYLSEEMGHIWTEKTLRDKLNKYFRMLNPGLDAFSKPADGGENNNYADIDGSPSPHTRSVHQTPSNSGLPTPNKGASKSPAANQMRIQTNDDWMTDTWKNDFEHFQKRCEICHTNIQKSKKPKEWLFDQECSDAFMKLITTQFDYPGDGPGRGKYSGIVYAAAVKAIPEMYNMQVQNMRNKYANESAKARKRKY